MSHARLMSALLALALAGGWGWQPAAAQGIEPVKKAADAKASKSSKSAKAEKAGKSGDGNAHDPEAANRALEGGIKSYSSGKYEPAVAALSTALTSGGLPSQKVAKALYYRGLSYRKQGKSAQAIADLKSALWLKGGLTDSERAEAAAQHAAAYKEAGLGEAPVVEHTAAAEPAAAAIPAPPAKASPGSWQATTATAAAPSHALAASGASASAPAASTGSGIGGFFSGLFGSGGQAAAPPSAAPAPPVTTASTGPVPQVSTWVESTSVEQARSSKAKSSEAVKSKAADARNRVAKAAAAPKAGKFRLEVGTTTSRDEAENVARRLKAEHAADLASREPQIDEGKFGASKYYRVGIGPYATADEPGRLCAALKAKGVDCLVVTR